MKENRRLFACKSWMASALMLTFVGISFGRHRARVEVRVVKSETKGAFR